MTLKEEDIAMENEVRHHQPTPHEEVEKVLYWLGSFYEASLFGTREDFMGEFRKIERASGDQVLYFSEMLADAERDLREGAPGNFEESSGLQIQLMIAYISLANCAVALRPGLSIDQQWWRVCMAHSFLGRLRGSMTGEIAGAMSAVSGRAKFGAAVRHKENRDMKKEVFDWLSKNMERFSSLEAAAAEIARDVVPVKHRTAREWVGQWKKAHSSPTGAGS